MNAVTISRFVMPNVHAKAAKETTQIAESAPYQFPVTECFRQTTDQTALQYDAQHTDIRVHVADLLRPERMAFPSEPALGEQGNPDMNSEKQNIKAKNCQSRLESPG